MYFDSVSAALAMGGHGAFVWSAYLISTLVVIATLLGPWRRQRKFLQQLAARIKRETIHSDTDKEST